MSIVESTTRARVSVIPVSTFASADERWRITRRDGEVLGYVDRSREAGLHPFRASRLLVRQGRFVPVGDFWTMDDALDALR